MKINYSGKKVSLLTKHGKEKIIVPIIERNLGCRIELIQSFDTDELGTFDGTIEREGSQLVTARRKAHIGIDFSNNNMGIASEGSFVADPFSGFMPWNIEMVVFVDDLHGIEVVGIAQGSAMSMTRVVRDFDSLLDFADQAGFPSHHLMLRPEHENDPRVQKGISNLEELKLAFIHAQSESKNGKVFAENDLRAFCNPTRQQMIAQATEDLAQKLLSSCPQCQSPGYWKTKAQPGLPCKSCGLPTELPVCEIWTCKHCQYESHQPVSSINYADPQQCSLCNP
jgi:hypothetical protein